MRAAVEHGESVAGAVADGEDDRAGVDLLAGPQGQASDVAGGVEVDIIDAGREAVFAAQGFDFCADALDDGHQAEGADMGSCRRKDFVGGAGFDKFGQQFAGEVAWVFDAAVELAVGESAGTALAELDV
jgi:hypothetical protein